MPGTASVRGSASVVGMPDDSWLFTAPECTHRPASCLIPQADILAPKRCRSTRVTFCLETWCGLSALRQIRSRSSPQGLAPKSFVRDSGEAAAKHRLCPRDAEFLESAHFIHRGMQCRCRNTRYDIHMWLRPGLYTKSTVHNVPFIRLAE